MAKMNLLQAINNALITVMTEDERVMVFGEDVGHFGGVFRATSHLQEKFGKGRCFNTPLTEQGIIGFANGLAAQGSVPVAEIQFGDYIFPAFDQIVNETAKFRYRSGGQFSCGTLTIRTPYGGGISGGVTHGETDEFSYNIARDPVHIRDLNATILHLMGIDHERFSVKHRGLDERLTGVQVKARVVQEVIS